MAVSKEVKCRECGKVEYQMVGVSDYPSLCRKCEKKEEQSEKDKFVRQFTEMPTEKAIAKIAGMLYDLEKRPAGRPFGFRC